MSCGVFQSSALRCYACAPTCATSRTALLWLASAAKVRSAPSAGASSLVQIKQTRVRGGFREIPILSSHERCDEVITTVPASERIKCASRRHQTLCMWPCTCRMFRLNEPSHARALMSACAVIAEQPRVASLNCQQ